jgi:N,N'-diacetylchitobiose transport system permease protein
VTSVSHIDEHATDAAGEAGAPPSGRRSHRPRTSRLRRVGRASVPYLLLMPVIVVMTAILGYPLYKLATLSLQRYGLPELIQRRGEWVGLDNFDSVLHDRVFWDTLVRTVVFTVVNVGLTMLLGMLVALLLVRVSRVVRVLLSAGLVLVWSMPVVVAVQVWYWMTNFQNGVLNHILTQLRIGDYFQHDWYDTTFSKLAMVTLLIVWGALPFVAITIYAGLAQVPRELVEAAAIDGAGPVRVFRDVTVPILKPILLILTSLSILWDFGVFTQPYLLIGASHADASNYLMGVYVFIEGYGHSDFGRGAAISLLMLLIVAVMSVVYVRRMVRMEEVR